MKKYISRAIILAIAIGAIAFNAYSANIDELPPDDCIKLYNGGFLAYNSCEEQVLGADITTILATDKLKDSRAVINTNFANLNNNKLENSDFTGSTGITYTATGTIAFDCSEVEGTGINCSGENITLDNSGNWAGTFDGQQGTYYLALANATGDTDDISEGSANLFMTQAGWAGYLAGTTTTALTEGTNLYYTNARADARILATTSISSITELLNLDITESQISDLGSYITGIDYLSNIGDVSTTSLANGNILNYQDGWKSTSSLYIASDGKIGVGTTTPEYALDVNGAIQTNATFYGDTWSSATNNSMNIKPSGDEDDFISFKTVANRPTTKVEGGPFYFFESSSNVFTGLSLRKDDNHSGSIIYYKQEDQFGLSSKDPLVFKACGYYDDYVTICNSNSIPEISVASSSGFKINAGGTNALMLNHDGGNVGIGTTAPAYLLDVWGDTRINGTATTTNLTVTGNTKAGTIMSGTWNGTVITDAYISNTLTVDGYMQDTDINTFSELQSWVSDEILLKAGTLTDTKYCIWDDGNGDIVCNSEGGAGSSEWTDGGLFLYPTETSDVVVVGGNATTTTDNILEVQGNSVITDNSGDSPYLTFLDEDNSYFRIYQQSNSTTFIGSDSYYFYPQDDTNDHFIMQTITNQPSFYANGSYLRIGITNTTGHALSGAGDLLIAKDLEVDGTAFFDNGATTTNLTVTGNTEAGIVVSGTWEATDIGVAYGGTGVSTLTDHGVLIGSGATAITALTVGTNGQILIGSTGADPVFANLTCGDNITCTTGAGTLEIDVDDVFVTKTNYFATTTHETISDMPALIRPFAFGAISTSTLDKDGKYLIAGATSTVELMRMPYQWTISELGYDVTAGTAGMNLGDGTNWSGFKSVSTTFASSTISSNNTFTQGEALTVQVSLSANNTLLFITGLLTTD